MSTIAAPVRVLTPDDLLQMSDGKNYELVDGLLVERDMGSLSQLIGTRLARFLGNHCEPSGLAHVFSEAGFICFPAKPNQMRKPDVSCVRIDRLPFDRIGNGFIKIRPDLAVEVVSPGDTIEDFRTKLADYCSAAIPLVWVVYPRSWEVEVIRLDGTRADLGPDDELTGESILPGFRCLVSDLFAGLPAPAESDL